MSPALAICLAIYEPQAGLWARQLASLRAQSYTDWVCLVQDDCSSARAFARLQKSIAGDRRFRLRRNRRRLGFYHNFEATLRRVPSGTRYVAFCDHDDRWDPGKLAVSVAKLEASGALLVHSNLRLTDGKGRLLAPSSWIAGANDRVDLEMLCLANIVPGAGSVFRANLLEQALPFPKGPGKLYHDHWLAIVALAQGRLAYVDEPQYDYVQHGENSMGFGPPRQRLPLARRLRGLWQRWRHQPWQAELLAAAERDEAEFLQRGAFFARALRLRLGGRLKPGAEGELALVEASAASLGALAWLCLRGAWRGRDVYGLEPRLLEGALRLRRARFSAPKLGF